jgi:DNA-directed RNA polymerase specialized sigma subunit
VLLKETFKKKEITLESREMGDDLLVVLSGGEEAHVGSCILAIPRPALDNEKKISCTSSVMNLIGHKDEEVGREAAEAISKKLNKRVVLVCGIHYDGLSRQEIKEIRKISQRLVERFLKEKT